MSSEERELVAAARGGSRAALAAIFDRHWTTAWRAAYAITRNRELADDVAQDAFLRAAKALPGFDDRRPFAPWIARIAVNRALDLVRRERSASQRDDFPDEVSELGEPHDELQAAVKALPDDRRTVVVLHFFLGFTLEETAGILDIPPGTAASRLSRALTTLRNELEDARV